MAAAVKVKDNPLKLDFNHYINLLKLIFTKPNYYASLIPEGGSFYQPILFLIVNFCILSLLPLIIETVVLRNLSIIFIGITGTIVTLPLGILLVFIFSGIFFAIAKLLGAKGTFKGAFNATVYCTTPLILSWVPVAAFLFYALVIYLLIVSFSKLQSYSATRAGITILAPVLIGTGLLVAAGIFGLQAGKIF